MKDVLVSLKSALLTKIVYDIKSLKSMLMYTEQRKHAKLINLFINPYILGFQHVFFFQIKYFTLLSLIVA